MAKLHGFLPTTRDEMNAAGISQLDFILITGDKDLDAKFVKEAEAAGFVNLKGHRTVGGMRASIYNAMPVEGVRKLAAFMQDFEVKNR